MHPPRGRRAANTSCSHRLLHVTFRIMQASMLLAFVLGQNFFMHALAIPMRSLAEDYSNMAVTPASGQYWSKQDVLTLTGVCVGVVTVIIGLAGVLVASPKI